MNKEQKKILLNAVEIFYKAYKKSEIIENMPNNKEIYIKRSKLNAAIVNVDSLKDTFIGVFSPDYKELKITKDNEIVVVARKEVSENWKYEIITSAETIIKSAERKAAKRSKIVNYM